MTGFNVFCTVILILFIIAGVYIAYYLSKITAFSIQLNASLNEINDNERKLLTSQLKISPSLSIIIMIIVSALVFILMGIISTYLLNMACGWAQGELPLWALILFISGFYILYILMLYKKYTSLHSSIMRNGYEAQRQFIIDRLR